MINHVSVSSSAAQTALVFQSNDKRGGLLVSAIVFCQSDANNGICSNWISKYNIIYVLYIYNDNYIYIIERKYTTTSSTVSTPRASGCEDLI
jgi:hypothetical protein